ncbi:MAG: alkyl sulfatase dimerization domain-containing protein [Deltaproteobacteria bacterium]
MGSKAILRWFLRLGGGLLLFAAGLLFARTELGTEFARETARAAHQVKRTALAKVADAGAVDIRTRLLLENPELLSAIGTGFGGTFSHEVALNMFGHDHAPAIQDAKELSYIVEVGPRTWLIRMPVVNVVLFETDAGNVLVDTGMAPAGPAILEKIREVSDKPLHTIIYTHGHVDHAYGTRGILAGGDEPEQIIAHENILPRFDRYIRLRESIAGYMSQKSEQMPQTREDFVLPTITFSDKYSFKLGGETFVLQHRRGETDDQLYVWVPGRGALASADYYQGFLPNAGNGKRVQRYPEEWALALREMAALEPRLLLPAHGEAITEPAKVQEALLVHAEALQSIVDQTIVGLNEGLRQDEIFASVALPEHLQGHPLLNIQYVSPADISKMVLKRYAGWWDDIPSNWSPASVPAQGVEIVRLAGGMDALTARARQLVDSDPQMASHLADWAFYADPQDPRAQAIIIDVYRARILDPVTNTQEALAYLDQMARARARQLRVAGS